MQTDLKTLKERVLETAKRSSVGQRVQDVMLESDHDDEGGDFLRVIIQVSHGDKADYAALEALLEAIENDVGSIDERYPSVRFSDAA